MSDVQTYRTYLATSNPITEIETRFLDPAEDLVSLAPSSRRSAHLPVSTTSDTDSSADYYFPPSDDILTPVPRRVMRHHHHRPNTASPTTFPPPSPSSPGAATDPAKPPNYSRTGTHERTNSITAVEQGAVGLRPRDPTPVRLLQIVAAAAVAFEIPVLAFRAVHGVAACVAVALVAAVAVGWDHLAGLLGCAGSGRTLVGMTWWWRAACAGAYGVVMAFVLGWVL